VRVNGSEESVVRDFLASWSAPSATTLASFLAEDAVWVDGPNGVHHGATAIVDELMRQLTTGTDLWVEIDTLLASDGTVMVEWHGGLSIGSASIKTKVMVVFELDSEGRIQQMRESFDMQSLVDQIPGFDPGASRSRTRRWAEG
jgi:limonene-1,2-epoxide hydrolase